MGDIISNNQAQLNREYEKSRFAVPHNILRSEAVYGEGFQSPGGLSAFQQNILPHLSIANGNHILDVGSGLGGASFYLAANYEVSVVGVDLAETMISLAKSRQERLDPRRKTTFLHCDVFSDNLAPGTFDAIFTQDTLMYVADKPAILARFEQLLKPGGKLVINDFCEGQRTLEYDEYVDVSGLYLATIPDYGKMTASAGFSSVKAEDISVATALHLKEDLDGYLENAAQKSIDADVEHLVARWKRKIGLLEAGSLAQGLCCASKPHLSQPN